MSASAKLESVLTQFVAGIRNYRPHSVERGIVQKVWNHGHGSLALFRVYPRKHVIVVNYSLFNLSDAPKLAHLINELEKAYPRSFRKWNVFRASLGYPEYYNHELSIEGSTESKEERR